MHTLSADIYSALFRVTNTNISSWHNEIRALSGGFLPGPESILNVHGAIAQVHQPNQYGVYCDDVLVRRMQASNVIDACE